MKELKLINRNNELTGINCQKCSRARFADLIVQKWSETFSFFYDFMWSTTWWRCGWHMKSNSRYSLVHILSTSYWKSGWNLSVFLRFMWNQALLQSRAQLSTSSSKSAIGPAVFFRFLCEIELQSRTNLVDHFPDRGAQPQKHRVLRPKVFSAVNSQVPDRSHMMVWLTWWCDS